MFENFNKLESSFYLLENNIPVAGISDNKNGCVALTFCNKIEGEIFIANNFPLERAKNTQTKKVNNAFDFLILCAKNGLIGIELFDENDVISFNFLVENHDLGSTWPTTLMTRNEINEYHLLNRFNKLHKTNIENYSEWKNYAILDKTTAKFAKKLPFNNWENGQVLYEIIKDNNILRLFNLPFLGNYGPADGSIAFFSNLDLAISFLKEENYLKNTLIVGPFEMKSKIKVKELANNYQIIEIADLNERILELSKWNSGCSYLINPNGTRDSQVYGSLLSSIDNKQITGVSGIWQIGKDNYIEFINSKTKISGNDNFYSDFGPVYKLTQLQRSFSIEKATNKFIEYSQSEIEFLINETLKKIEFDEYIENSITYTEIPTKILDKYIIVYCDVVSGEESILYLNSIFEIFSWLINYEYHEDKPGRTNGINTPFSIGLEGSGNLQTENKITDLLLEALKQNLRLIIKDGYNPQIALNLTRLYNIYCKTIQIKTLGYIDDILWQSEGEQTKEILKLIKLDEEIYFKHEIEPNLHVDSEGEQIAIKLIGKELWNILEKRSRHFIASSLVYFNKDKHSPQLDYSLISIGFVKAVEYEFGLLTKQFLSSVNLNANDFQRKDPLDNILYKIYKSNDSKAPYLGNYPYVLDFNQNKISNVHRLMYDFFKNLVNGEFWTSLEFYGVILDEILNKYRNGGAHDSSISYATCIECMNCILGTENESGIIKKIAQSKLNLIVK